MKVDGATRAGRPKGQGLASCSWLLVLAGISCTYPVQLPGVLDDAGRNAGGTGGLGGSDASVDRLSSSDRPGFYGCPNPRSIIPNAWNTAEMIIALDRSTSMQHAFGSTTSRWQAARLAILAAINNHPRIKFGLEQFPGASDCNNGAACCAGTVFFSAAPNQSNSIATQMACGPGDADCPPAGDDSPSPLALIQCSAQFAKEGQQEWGFSRFVLLMTDRDPTCAGDLSPGTSPCGVAIDEASKLGAPGVSVQLFVVALNGDGPSTECLRQVAAANASTLDDSQQFYPATDPTDLADQLDTIMTLAEKPLCWFFLGGHYNNPDQLKVTVNGESVAYDPSGQDGWNFYGPYIVLAGSSCTEVKAGLPIAVTAC